MKDSVKNILGVEELDLVGVRIVAGNWAKKYQSQLGQQVHMGGISTISEIGRNPLNGKMAVTRNEIAMKKL